MRSPDPPDLARILLGKAADDEFALRRLSMMAGAPDAVLGFHAQQAVEKLLKAVLASRSVSYPFTHDLRYLTELVESQSMVLPVDADHVDVLTDYAAVLRYEDPLEPRPFESGSAIALVERVRTWATTIVEEEHAMPHANIFPALRYRDADAAIAWLGRAFGFEEKAVHRSEDGTVQHAELRLGAGMVMVGQPSDWPGGIDPDALASTVSMYVVIEDPDAHYARAKAAGAQIVKELVDEAYGSREYSARDLEGNLWSFGTYDPYATG